MPKILTSIGVIAIVISFYLIGYFLYQNNNQELQITQENIQNIFQEIKSKKEVVREKKIIKILLFFRLSEFLSLSLLLELLFFYYFDAEKKKIKKKKKKKK